jgi:SAM-dependent methyltransferase
MGGIAETVSSAALAEGLPCPICLGVARKTLSRHRERSLTQCLDCGGSFVSPQPSAAEIASHFQDTGATPDEDLERNFERNRERVLARVAQYIQGTRSPGSILDVGCATGFFLARFFGKTPWQASAIELSRHKARRAAQNGIRVFVGDIHAAKFGTGVFDVITVLDAFYYFPNPQRELAEFRRILKDGGLLVLELPWAKSRIWRRSVAEARLLPGSSRPLLETSDHLFYYTPKSIALLLERCGFQARARVTLPGNRQERVSRDLLWRLYGWFSRVLGIVSGSKLFLGPRFLVVAEKPPES